MTELLCPKCQAPLRSYERNEVTVERCTECGGVFLDRGELERIMAAEASFNRERRGWLGSEDDGVPVHEYEDSRRLRRPRSRGFLGDLFGDD